MFRHIVQYRVGADPASSLQGVIAVIFGSQVS